MIHGELALATLDRLAERSLDAYGLGPRGRATRISVSENATYALDDGGRRALALRFYRPGVRSDDAIRSEIAWIEALGRDRVVRTPAPVAGRDGAVLRRFPDGQRAVAFRWSDGKELAPEADLPSRFRALGAIAARLHVHARRWSPPRFFTRPRWDLDAMIGRTMLWGDYRAAPGLAGSGRAVLERAAARVAGTLDRVGTGADRFGLVHGDLRLANILADGDALTVIDFDDCGFSWLAYDFAASASFLEHLPVLPALGASWCAGYRTVAPFADEAILPTLVMLRRLLLTAWVGSHPEAETARTLGADFAAGTVRIAETFLAG